MPLASRMRLLSVLALSLALGPLTACSDDGGSSLPFPTPDAIDGSDSGAGDVDTDVDTDTGEDIDEDGSEEIDEDTDAGADIDVADVPTDIECSEGFVFDPVLGDCADIDECAEGFECDPTFICFNTEGSVECLCPPGADLVGDLCVDIDECAEEGVCGENATCFNETFSFECVCDIGFTGDGQTCEAECDLTCGENEICVAGTDSEICACITGFAPRDGVCQPIDLCERTAQREIEILDLGVVDCVTPSVCLATVPDNSADLLFNALTEEYADLDVDCEAEDYGVSPAGTLWAAGFCEDLEDTPNEAFVPFAELSRCRVGRIDAEGACMLSIAENIRVSFVFDTTRTSSDGNAITYVRTSVGGCDDSATCESAFPRAECSCPEGVPMLADGSCDLSARCTLDCGEFGACVFGDAGRICECESGYLWNGTACMEVPACSGSLTYVHQPGAAGDCWNDGVCLTRDNRAEIYNVLLEIRADTCSGGSPAGVEWARGTCDDQDEDAEFDSLTEVTGCGTRNTLLDDPLCAELPSGERVDVVFTEFGLSREGLGGYVFAYERDSVNRCFDPSSCDEDADTCACPEGFEGDGIDCTFLGECDLDCGENGECVRGALGPECLCDAGFDDLGEGCVDVDVCEGDGEVLFTFSEATGFAPDCIREDVCFARNEGGGGPIYNTITDDDGDWADSDPNVLWGLGSCADEPRFLALRGIRDQVGQPFVNVIGRPLCLRLGSPTVEHDLTFLSFSQNGEDDAGFSYVRTLAERPCGPNSTCEDAGGAPTCGCAEGFEADDSGACVDTNECDDNACGEDVCVNLSGTFLCECGTVAFEKTNYSEEADCLSEDVCIARGDFQSIYNSVQDESFDGDCSISQLPTGTLWSQGGCAEQRPRDRFHSDRYAGCSPPTIVGTEGCLELEASGRLFDVEWTSWQSGGDPDPTDPSGERDGGGGFSYVRTEVSIGAACDAP